jgi:hypothetical protein
LQQQNTIVKGKVKGNNNGNSKNNKQHNPFHRLPPRPQHPAVQFPVAAAQCKSPVATSNK